MSQTNQIGRLLDEASSLSFDEQETLLEVLQKRLIEARRLRLAKDVHEANEEFKKGNCSVGDANSVFKEIIS
ncbi:MAG: hypothetical protein H7A33_04385 [Deltaproteobacteria bacterium]|nr:hypothetical protein [Deltaproteobacteria bacterium]